MKREEPKAEDRLWEMAFPLETRKGKEASSKGDLKEENSYEENQQDVRVLANT